MAIAERWGWGFRGAYTGVCTYERETRDNDELDKGDSTNTVSVSLQQWPYKVWKVLWLIVWIVVQLGASLSILILLSIASTFMRNFRVQKSVQQNQLSFVQGGLGRSCGTGINSYDLTTCPSWAQAPNGPYPHTISHWKSSPLVVQAGLDRQRLLCQRRGNLRGKDVRNTSKTNAS